VRVAEAEILALYDTERAEEPIGEGEY